MKLLVSLGFFDDSGEGRLVGVDLASGRSDVLLSYLPPPSLRVPSRGFAGACLSEDGAAVFAAGHAAVYRISTRSWMRDGILHLPSFNDLHHVAAGSGRIYVANTGSDSVDVFSSAGRWIGSYPSNLPSRLHPNHICLLADQTLVTCLEDGSIRDLRTLQIVHQQEHTSPHDGLVADGRFYFTTVDGKLHALPMEKGRLPIARTPLIGLSRNEVTTQCWDLFQQTGRYGCCRGLAVQPGENGMTAAVGISEVRRDYMPRHKWIDRPPERSQTGILWLELSSGRLLGWVDLSDEVRHSKIYSLLPWCGN